MKLLKLYAIIASIFSVAFSLSILLEIDKFTDRYVTIVIGIFVLFVMVVNETIKVNQLRQKFKENKKTSSLICFTVGLSIIMSSIGIYLFTSESHDEQIKVENKMAEDIFKTKRKFTFKKDSLLNLANTNSEYLEIQKNISFWKERKCYNDKERSQARQNIYELELKRQALHSNYQQIIDNKIRSLESLEIEELEYLKILNSNIISVKNYNFWLFIIIFALVIVTEIMIIYIQYLVSNIYTPDQKRKLKIFQTLLMNTKDQITLNDIKYHPDNPLTSKDEREGFQYSKNLYFLAGNLGLIDHDGNILEKENALLTLQKYFITENNSLI
jgi:hypothetical protein